MSLVRITVPHGVTQEAHELIAGSHKIRAIKLVRSKGQVIGRDDPRVGLREAKYAIDHLSGLVSTSDTGAILVPEWNVNSLTVTGPMGQKIELNIDELQMHFLTSLHSVGLEEVSRLMELVEYVKRWQGETSSSETIVSDSGD